MSPFTVYHATYDASDDQYNDMPEARFATRAEAEAYLREHICFNGGYKCIAAEEED